MERFDGLLPSAEQALMDGQDWKKLYIGRESPSLPGVLYHTTARAQSRCKLIDLEVFSATERS